MRRLFWLIIPALLMMPACNPNEEEDPGKPGPVSPEKYTTVKVSMPSGIPVYWADGDVVNVNGVSSSALEGIGAEASSAIFVFSGELSTPYKLLYPDSFYSDAGHIDLPSSQSYSAGKLASNTAPLCGYSNNPENGGTLNHLCAFIRIPVKKDADVSASSLSTLKFKGNNGEQVCGVFRIDYENHTIQPAGAGDQLALNVGQPLSESTALDLYLAVPTRNYSNGFSIELEDDGHRIMKAARSGSIALEAGNLTVFDALSFRPSDNVYELTFEGEDPVVVNPPEYPYNVSGRVVDNKGNGIEGVVVSDGAQCVRTISDGSFCINSELANVKYVFVSTPSGYMPEVKGGIPRFYKEKSSASVSDGNYDFGDYVLTPVDNPNSFTLLITADPQPRTSTATLDNVAYRSLKCCKAMYRDLKETAEGINGRQVYGICLGDLVHGNSAANLALMDDYASALGDLGYPTYNIIGNHDYDVSAADDDGGAWKFESLFGPRSYSFNIGGIHFVMLDNLIMKQGSGGLTAFDQGLTDESWTWLQNDMALIPTGTTVMVCAHSPMFRLETSSERSNTAKHGPDYGALFDKYKEVHAWAGHTHSTFNYIYSGSHRHKNIQVHTLARSTGELWTNEYLANGTPRGFTVVDIVDGKVASWHFHPTKYLMSNHHGTKGQPDYIYCDWEYVSFESIKIARMKDTGQYLDDSYQMHVYAPGAYGDNYVYANVFLWDEKWENPVFTPEGGSPVTMTHLAAYNGSTPIATTYDCGDAEFRTFYYNNYLSTLGSDYTATNPGLHTLFRAPVSSSSGKGTVSVKDRFGNVYTRPVCW